MPSHVLIVDDDADFCALVARQLTAAGYEVSSARSAREANEILTSATIALAIVDGFLSDRDGESWIVAQRAASRKLPIIFVSAFATYARDFATQQRLTRDLGVAHVLAKPIDPTTLLSYVDKLLVVERVSPTLSRLAQMRKTYGTALTEKLAVIATSISLAKSTRSPMPLAEARRHAHTLEGTAGSYGFTAVGDAAGRVFELLTKPTPQWDAIDASVDDLRARVFMAQAAL